MTESLVRLEKNGAMITLTLDNPPVNAKQIENSRASTIFAPKSY
ncbi:MAG: hypothetical protein JWQ07_5547 [Ramlibacter sp.]|nr:hypothetical protein [Ramlibacter sp.]